MSRHRTVVRISARPSPAPGLPGAPPRIPGAVIDAALRATMNLHLPAIAFMGALFVLPATARQPAAAVPPGSVSGLTALAGADSTAASTVTLFLVRHAEKAATPADDPGLTEEGGRRAGRLAGMLANARIGRIVVSQYRRTRETAEPLSRRTGVPLTVLPVRMDSASPGELAPDHLDSLFAAIRSAPGGRVLIVGHSNTIPAMMRALGAEQAPAIGDREYGDFLILRWAPGRAAEVIGLKY